MENEDVNLNTESNDIAGNRIDGPVGNTAAKPGLPGRGVGIPGGAPTQASAAPAASPTNEDPAAPTSSESLVDSEMSAGQGGVDAEGEEQENKEANPADLTPTESAEPTDRYGGNFSNSTQGSYRDQARRDNQDSDPSRGEFGAQDLGGTTHGGFGNQNRLANYEPQGTAEDRYYGGAGRPGQQDNAYRTYDGRDERPDQRTEYGFVAGSAVAATSGQAADSGHVQGTAYDGPNADNRNQPERTDANSSFQNDNGSVAVADSGYASDYGQTSLQGGTASRNAPNMDAHDLAGAGRRNQTEDYLPAQAGFDREGHREEQHPYSADAPEVADQRAPRPLESQGYGDRGREEPRKAPDFRTGDDRNGYVRANEGDANQGIGSQGGSYNDAYDDSQPGSKAGSPAQGDQRTEDLDQNYGSAARQENRSGDANAADHGAPRRNAGRDGEADE